MSGYAPLVIAVTVIALLALVVVLARQGHGEFSAGHGVQRFESGNDWELRAPGGRLGGPGQAGQAVIAPGQIAPSDPWGRSQH